MTINPYFTQSGGTANQKDLYEDLIIEALKIYGQEMKYVPREIITKDDIFGEDTFTRFKNALSIEMYIENTTGFDGQDLFQKFGVEIRDEATLVVSKRRWTETITDGFLPDSTDYTELLTREGNTIKTRESRDDPYGSIILARDITAEALLDTAISGDVVDDLSRPREGDLIFMPNANALFEITFVEHEQPFYQLNNLPVYKLGISLFEFAGEEMDLVDIGFDEEKLGSEYELVVDDATGFVDGEDITQTQGTVVVRAEIQKIVIDSSGHRVFISNTRNNTSDFVVMTAGQDITGITSGATTSVSSVEISNNDGYNRNVEIEQIADSITEFDINSPFGDF